MAATSTEYDAEVERAMREFSENKKATKRLRLNHDIDKFTILRSIVRNYLNLINIYKIQVEFPWLVADHITNLPDWETEALELMLLFGIVGYRCNYLPFYKVELLTHANELVNFGFEEDRFYWLSNYVEEVALRLPCLYADGRRPSMQVPGATTSLYWMFNGLLSHLYKEYQLHDALHNDTRIASNTSAAGMYTRTVDLEKMDNTNALQAKRFKTLNNPTITTDINEGQSEDVKNMIDTANALMDAVDDGPLEDENGDVRRRPTRLPPPVVDTVIYPPKILMGAFISYEGNMRQYVAELVINSVDECKVFMERALQAIYDAFLAPDVFYGTYRTIYLNMLDEIEAVMQRRSTVLDSGKVRRKPKSVPYFRHQIVQWMQQHRRAKAEHLAFFQTLTPQTYENFLAELATRYEGRTYAEMEEDERMAIVLAWIEAELAFCDKELRMHARIAREREKELKEQREADAEAEAAEADGKKKKKKKEAVDPNAIVYSWNIIKPVLEQKDAKVNRSNEFLNQ